jgi:hypothetical protein
MLYSESLRLPNTNDPLLKKNETLFVQLPVVGLPGSISSGDDALDNSSGPFIGVSSRSKHSAVITYYGIDRHNQWVFTPMFR